jgi:hypothetical protein
LRDTGGIVHQPPDLIKEPALGLGHDCVSTSSGWTMVILDRLRKRLAGIARTATNALREFSPSSYACQWDDRRVDEACERKTAA